MSVHDELFDLLNMGYTMEEAKKFLECIKEIEITPEEVQSVVEVINSIGCTSFYLTSEDIEKITSVNGGTVHACYRKR